MGSHIKVMQVPIDRISLVWPAIVGHLVKGISVSRVLSADEVAKGLCSGDFSLWIVLRGDDFIALYMTRIEDDGNEDFVWLFGLYGEDVADWIDECNRVMTNYAREHHLQSVRLAGRRAWVRMLPVEFAVIDALDDHYVYRRSA